MRTDGRLALAVDAIAAAVAAEGGDERHVWATVTLRLLRRVNPGLAAAAAAVERWYEVPPLELKSLSPLSTIAILSEAQLDSGFLTALGAVFERRQADFIAARRQGEGVHFTPAVLSDRMARSVVDTLAAEGRTDSLTICDPSAGVGAFLIPAVFRLAERRPEATQEGRLRRAIEHIYGIDIDPLTVSVLRTFLWIAGGGLESSIETLERNIRHSDALIGPSWSDTLGLGSQRFSAIIGNPPWASLRPTLSRWTGTAEEWEHYSAARRKYAEALRSADYEHQGRGDADLYKFFLERALNSVAEDGVVAMLLPGAVMRAEGAAPLRRHMLGAGRIERLTERLNVDRAFRIHPMFRYVELQWRRTEPGGIDILSLGNAGVRKAENHITLSRSELQTLGGIDASVPDIRTVRQRDLLTRLMEAHPPLSDAGEWNVRLRRELDVTNASKRFVRADQTLQHGNDLVPLYEGRMVNQHDAMAKGWVSGNGRSAVWETLTPIQKAVRPQFLVPRQLAGDRIREQRAGFCDITGHANERTLLAALIPSDAIAGNKVPTVEFDRSDPRLNYIWIAIANSFVVDWLVRRRVSTTFNHFYWRSIPFPRVDPNSADGATLYRAALDLTSWAGEDAELETRAVRRLEIDVVVARLFGISESDMEVILQDFPLLDRGQKHSVTAKALMSALQGEEAQATVSRSPGIPYVPAGLARALERQVATSRR